MELAWLTLFVAGVFEVAWAVGLKLSHGFTRLWPTLFTLATMSLSFALLARAVRYLPIGPAYAVWTGIGVAGTALLGMLLLGEPRTLGRLLCTGLILAGIVGLRLLNGD